MSDYIRLQRVEGVASRQAHADLPAGTYEREISKEGFFGPASFIYHRNPPTNWTNFEGSLQPHAYDLGALKFTDTSPWAAAAVLHNASVKIRFWSLSSDMASLARNADGDDLLFIHSGSGDLFCDYGRLAYTAGDYILIPRGTMWRLSCRSATSVLMIECTNGSYKLPDRGMLGPTALFDTAILDTPKIDAAFLAQQSDSTPWTVHVKKRDAVSTMTFPFNPLDAVGWHGDLTVARLNVKDIRPVVSARYHLPPSVHTTFLGQRFVVCTFTPRPFETDPGAIKVPFFHNNDDYDEVIFYHDGNFFSRDDIKPGMMTFHPAGFTHGPHPKALKNMLQQPKPATEEYAVMIDTRDPLDIGDAALTVERQDYVDSWKSK
ncbi:MAG: homogentisate 1,2-dioxygenase [Rhodospirillaceae bacterium]|nr:homogentisate 1,2-dioxygenase [Rhodospirillaceae bacterium]